ncbi:MAG: hypothetical protein LAT55_06940 [Opitutales bacterium]|nr:hypothetical protein [Opitutales bacterium]
MNQDLKFIPHSPIECEERYTRIPGKSTTFLAKADGTIIIRWYRNDGEIWECPANRDSAIDELANAVNSLKTSLSNSPGGAFQINEFGQVLVPSSNGRCRHVVGTLEGVPEFTEPGFGSHTFSLDEKEFFLPGKTWSLPYIGMPYVMPQSGQYFYWRVTEDGKFKKYPPAFDRDLQRAFFQIRRGAGRFIVNPHGLVLTKKDPSGQPVLVCKINLSKWYPKIT